MEEEVSGLPAEAAGAETAWAWAWAYMRDHEGRHWGRAAEDAWRPLSPSDGARWYDAMREMGRRIAALDTARISELGRERKEALKRQGELRMQLLAAINERADRETISALDEAQERASEEAGAAFNAWREAATTAQLKALAPSDDDRR